MSVVHDGANSIDVKAGRDGSPASLPLGQLTEWHVPPLEGDQSLFVVFFGSDFFKVVDQTLELLGRAKYPDGILTHDV